MCTEKTSLVDFKHMSVRTAATSGHTVNNTHTHTHRSYPPGLRATVQHKAGERVWCGGEADAGTQNK